MPQPRSGYHRPGVLALDASDQAVGLTGRHCEAFDRSSVM